MTLNEFSVEFDVLYNNITSGQAPGLSEYEKSVFLTQAQESIVVDLYSGRLIDSFESTEEVSEYLRTLIHEVQYSTDLGRSADMTNVLSFPKDLWFRVFEGVILGDKALQCKGTAERYVDVYPVTQDTYYRTLKSPFRGPNERRVLRIDVEGGFRLVSKYDIAKYILRYIQQPKPIIIDPEGLSINGVSEKSECQLPSVLHRTILLKAVDLAKAIWKS